ncbi:VOC family protein [Halococcus sp. PRR34]|uniref:VOC family protein n=1 Tax=Halococcus sp. PRR34 TaxID=3020830 RepID=UPI002362F8B4|nr:VOC family protein [Halococcus sp. PRR34]
MAGIVFFDTAALDRVVEFYTERLDASVWLEQSGCTILRHENFLVGFCAGDTPETEGTITLFYDDRSGVDEMYDRIEKRARGRPEVNEAYDIYQFFADDPEGRTLEFQTFLHPIDPEVG